MAVSTQAVVPGSNAQPPPHARVHQHRLAGCTSRPLASYLKALGVLRVLAEQVDRDARGRWTAQGVFELQTRLSREQLEEFFLHHYRPTPLLSPWNAGAGFCIDPVASRAQKVEAKFKIEIPKIPRLDRITKAIHICIFLLSELALCGHVVVRDDGTPKFSDYSHADKRRKFYVHDPARGWTLQGKSSSEKIKQTKKAFISLLRNHLEDEVVSILDSVALLVGSGFDMTYGPVWGGGNDGRLEFSSVYLQMLVGKSRQNGPRPIFDENGALNSSSHALVKLAFWGNEYTRLLSRLSGNKTASLGLLFPIRTGGPNAGVGFKNTRPMANPWDFVLAAEGAALLAGAATRRYGASRRSKAAVPFRVDATAAGQGALSDRDNARAELWLPLWGRWASCAELRALFGQGRVQVGRRHAERGLDFVRALATLGADRGFDAFERYAVMERNGQSNLAVPLGTYWVSSVPGVRLLDELDAWIWRVESRATSRRPQAPASLRSAWRRYQDCVFDWCQAGEQASAERAGDVLRALGELEQALVVRRPAAAGSTPVAPLPPLTGRWLEHVRQQTPEYRLAEALASLVARRSKGELDTLRGHLEPIRWAGRRVAWDTESNDCVWTEGSVEQALLEVLHRRLFLAPGWRSLSWRRPADAWTPVTALPGERACAGARLQDVAAFLERETDDALLIEWLRGLSLLDWPARLRRLAEETAQAPQPGPSARASSKCWRLPHDEDQARALLRKARPSRAPLDPLYALLRLCLSGGAVRDRTGRPLPLDAQLVRLAAAGRGAEAAQRAARRLRAAGYAPLVREVPVSAERARRVAAALLFPITLGGLAALADAVLGEVPPLWV